MQVNLSFKLSDNEGHRVMMEYISKSFHLKYPYIRNDTHLMLTLDYRGEDFIDPDFKIELTDIDKCAEKVFEHLGGKVRRLNEDGTVPQ